MLDKTREYLSEMGVDIFWFRTKLISNDKTDDINLSVIEKNVKDCKKCSLHKIRDNIVFGDGDSTADLMIIGEAPGCEEDKAGKPFVGRAGKLLNSFLSSINLDRESIFITNTIKCRPPDNRNPSETEIQSCSSFLDRQINIIKPKVLVLLGKIAANRLLNQDKPISELRLKKFFIEKYNIPIIVFYHPAYILRSPSQKAKVWDDLKFLKSIISSDDC